MYTMLILHVHRATTNLYIYTFIGSGNSVYKYIKLTYSRQRLGVYNVKGVIQVGLKETISHGLI